MYPNVPEKPVQAKKEDAPMQIMPQTKVAFIGYLLILLSMVIYLIQNPSMANFFVPAILAYVVIYLFALYVINCTVTGNCNLLAWVIAYIVVILAVLTILGLIMTLYKN